MMPLLHRKPHCHGLHHRWVVLQMMPLLHRKPQCHGLHHRWVVLLGCAHCILVQTALNSTIDYAEEAAPALPHAGHWQQAAPLILFWQGGDRCGCIKRKRTRKASLS